MLLKSSNPKKRAVVITAVVFVAMMIIPMLLLVVYSNTYNALTTQEITQEQTLSGLASLAVKVRLDNLVNIASSIASSQAVVSAASYGQWSDASDAARDLENSVNFYDPFIDRIVIDDPNGIQQAAYPQLVGGLGYDASSTPWFLALTQGNQPFYVTNVGKRTSSPHIQVVNIAVPIKSQQAIVGFVLLQIPTDNFLDFGETLALGTYGFAYVVDSQGNIVAHPKYSSDDGGVVNFSSVPEVGQVILGNTGSGISTDNTTGEKSLVSYKPVDTYGWGVVTQEPYSEAFATRSGILFGLELLIICISIVNILVAYIIFRVLHSRNHAKKS